MTKMSNNYTLLIFCDFPFLMSVIVLQKLLYTCEYWNETCLVQQYNVDDSNFRSSLGGMWIKNEHLRAIAV